MKILFILLLSCCCCCGQRFAPIFTQPSSGGGVSVPNPNVAWYKFTEGSGFTTSDSSGNGYTGLLTNTASSGNASDNPQWTTGPTGHGALAFSAANQTGVATICSNALGDFTVSLWFYATSGNVSGDAYQRLLDKSYANGFYLGHNGSSEDVTQWGGGIEQVSSPYGTFTAFTLGQWNMITMSRSGTTQKIYVNGTLEVTASVASSATDNTPLWIGWDASMASVDAFTGTIADVGVWNSALTDTQVSAWYSQGAH